MQRHFRPADFYVQLIAFFSGALRFARASSFFDTPYW
jgi:hypothetical protein